MNFSNVVASNVIWITSTIRPDERRSTRSTSPTRPLPARPSSKWRPVVRSADAKGPLAHLRADLHRGQLDKVNQRAAENEVKQALAAGPKCSWGLLFGNSVRRKLPRLLCRRRVRLDLSRYRAWRLRYGNRAGYLPRCQSCVGIAPIVRVATDVQYPLIARALDCGAQGYHFSQGRIAGTSGRAVSWTQFPPRGARGFGLAGPQIGYGAHAMGPEVIGHMNANTLVVLQIETVRAFEARDEFLSVPGIDAVLIGPADLSVSFGVPGEFQTPAW